MVPGRCVAGILEAGATGGIVAYAAYFQHGIGMVDANLDLLLAIAAHAAIHGRPWILAADFNVTPIRAAAGGVARPG